MTFDEFLSDVVNDSVNNGDGTHVELTLQVIRNLVTEEGDTYCVFRMSDSAGKRPLGLTLAPFSDPPPDLVERIKEIMAASWRGLYG